MGARHILRVSAFAAIAWALPLLGVGHSAQNGGPDALRQVVVVPFRCVDDDAALAKLGREMSQSVADRLSDLKDISVLAGGIVHVQAHDDGLNDALLKPADALSLSKRLGGDLLVEGEFRKVGDSIQVECSILDIASGKVQGAKPLSIKGVLPSGYPGLLHDLPNLVARAIQPDAPPSPEDAEPTPEEAAREIVPEGTVPADAHELLATGLEQSQSDSESDLAAAQASFGDAIAKDADFAEAWVAKSEAETRLAKIKLAAQADATELKRQAEEDALTAVEKAPYFGAAHQQLAKALMLNGDFKGAALSAKIASLLWPGSGESHLEMSQALDEGKIQDDAEFQTAMRLTPALAITVPELPKVRVVNDGEGVLEFTFTDEKGRVFAIVDVPSGQSRLVGLISGHYTITSERQGVKTETSHDFGAGVRYALNDKAFLSDSSDHSKDATGTYVVVGCAIPGAIVSIDGIDIGPAPIKRMIDPTNAHDENFTVKVNAVGYKTYEKEVHVDPGRPVDLTATLEPNLNVGDDEAGASGRCVHNPRTDADMIYIPGGTFTLGDDGEPTNPSHEAALTGYWIGKTPVTTREFLAFDRAIRSLPPDQRGGVEPFDRTKVRLGNPDEPMVGVTWSQARAYCHYVHGELPTADQWEHAARGPMNYQYPWGPDFDPARLQWSPGKDGAAIKPCSVNAHPNGASPFGCLDMAGNVWQWCLDNYSSPIAGNPIHPLVGGSWHDSDPKLFRSTVRHKAYEDPSTVGFRVVFKPD